MNDATILRLLHHCHWYWALLVSVVLNVALGAYIATNHVLMHAFCIYHQAKP